MKAIAFWGGVLVLGLVLGIGSAFYTLKNGALSGNVAVGPWGTGTSFGSAEADMYTRARVALFGLFALDKKETMYYTALHDSDGGELSGSCTYRVEGKDLAARWWSITAYGPDSFLIPNEANIYSYAMTTVKREADGSYIIRVSPEKQEGNWLPVKAGEKFDLTARFYNPEASVYANPAAAELPRIVKESCK
ncbi:MAG: DUF1214 domain-containing protein [Parvibaculum sp.]|uniref:DUF1214 domain-containing protein n=1 Tax=Parvibaculum sp. TaxID=2024848 RepID=UPI003C7540C2